MNAQKRVLLLVGSPRGRNSTSESLGTYLLDRLREKGLKTETVRLSPLLKSDEGKQNLLAVVDGSDIIILVCPLYVDSSPAMVIKALEMIAKHRKSKKTVNNQQLLVICNSGFPEAYHNDTALAIYRRFAVESGFKWVGGLALGMGEAIAGQSLEKAGGKAKKVRRSLEMAADALVEGNPIPQTSVDLMARPFIPAWMYILFGGLGWKSRAKKNGVGKTIYSRPYQR